MKRLLPAFVTVVLASSVSLAGCAGGSSDEAPSASSSASLTASSSAAPPASPKGSAGATSSPDPDGPDGVELTQPGAQLEFGQSATVSYGVKAPPAQGSAQGSARGSAKGSAEGSAKGSAEGSAKGSAERVETVLKLTVVSATRGRLSDLAGFNLTDPYQRKAHYYYVRVSAKNVGEKRLSGVGVPLLGISGDDTLLPPVRFTSAFATCPTEQLPPTFKPGRMFRTCLVFLSPDKGRLAGVSYRPTEGFVPIEWHGKVAKPSKPSKPSKPTRKPSPEN